MIWLTTAILFLVYLNAPVVAVRIHGAPFVLGAAVPLALIVPVAYRVLAKGEAFRFPRLIVAAIVMLLLHSLSALVSVRPDESIGTLVTWLSEGVLLALLIANAVRTRREALLAVGAIVAAGATMGLITVVQQILGPADYTFGGFGQLAASMTDESGRRELRLAGPIGETNRFAQIMAVLIPVAAGFAMTTRGRMRAGFGAATLLIAAGMALAYSRGAIVALGLALPFALVFRFVRVRHLVASAVAAACMLLVLPHYAERVISIGEVAISSLGLGPVGIRNADGASRGRLTEMKSASLLFADQPILGAGPGLAPLYYPEYAPVVGGKVRPGTRRSHNLFLQLAAETGLVGLGAFFVVVGIAFRELEGARRRLERRDRVLWGVVCGLELALIISLTTSLFLHAAYIRYFWILLGLSAAVGVQRGATRPEDILVRLMRDSVARLQAGT